MFSKLQATIYALINRIVNVLLHGLNSPQMMDIQFLALSVNSLVVIPTFVSPQDKFFLEQNFEIN